MGFLIDAVAHGFDFRVNELRYIQMCNLAEIISSAPITAQALCRSVVDGVDSQA